MSVATEIQRLQTAKANIKTAIENQGVTVGDGTLDTYADLISQISGGGGGSETPTINGRVFDCGTFSLETDSTSKVTVQHSLGVVPSVAVMYVVDPPQEDADGNELRLMVKKLRSYSDTHEHSVSAFWNHSVLVAGVGSGGTRNGTTWTDTTITFYCDSTYPCRAGITYEWIALGGIV